MLVVKKKKKERKKPSILTWQGRYYDHEGGFPRVRFNHCTPGVLTPAISPNVGNSTAFVVVGVVETAFALSSEKKKNEET